MIAAIIKHVYTIASEILNTVPSVIFYAFSAGNIIIKMYIMLPIPPNIKQTFVPNLFITNVEHKLPIPMKK